MNAWQRNSRQLVCSPLVIRRDTWLMGRNGKGKQPPVSSSRRWRTLCIEAVVDSTLLGHTRPGLEYTGAVPRVSCQGSLGLPGGGRWWCDRQRGSSFGHSRPSRPACACTPLTCREQCSDHSFVHILSVPRRSSSSWAAST